MIEPRKRSSTLARVFAGVKAVALVAILGTIALAAVASHRGYVPLLEYRTSPITVPAAERTEAPGPVSPYLRKAADTAAETPPTE